MTPLKYKFFQEHVPFAGHIVSRDEIQPNPAKASAVRQYPVSKLVAEMKIFFLFLQPTVGSRFRSNCSTSSAANRENERFISELRSPRGFWTTERLLDFVNYFSLRLFGRAIHPVYRRKSVYHRPRSWPSIEWLRASLLLRFQISQQSRKSLLDNKARTSSYSQLHQTLQALPSWPTIWDH